MVPLPASQAVCAPSSAASARQLRSPQGSPRPSAQLRLSCSSHSLHARDSLHARSDGCPSRTLRAPWLSLSPSPSPQARCRSNHRPGTAPDPSSPAPSLSLPSMSSCRGLRALSSLHCSEVSSSQILPLPYILLPMEKRGVPPLLILIQPSWSP